VILPLPREKSDSADLPKFSTRLGGLDPAKNYFYCASGWYDAGTLIA
jgi:hypothetical protein